MYEFECVFCHRIYLTIDPWTCRICRLHHCRTCLCRLWLNLASACFVPMLYARKKPRPQLCLLDDADEVPVATESSGAAAARWGSAFSALFLGMLWYWSTAKANRAPSTSVIPSFVTQHVSGIKAFDLLLHRVIAPTTGELPFAGRLGVAELVYESLQRAALAFPRIVDLTKMIANPTPMPFTKVWQSSAQLAQTFRITAFLGFANEKRITKAIKDCLLLAPLDSQRLAKQLVEMRGELMRRGGAGLVSGFTMGMIPGMVIPGYQFTAGWLLPWNVAAMANSYSQTVSTLHQKALEVAPESTAKLMANVDSYWKAKAFRVKGAGALGLFTSVMGFGYGQYKQSKELVPSQK